MPLAITCSTAVEPRRRRLAGVGQRHDLLADRVHAADAGAEDRAGVPVARIVVVARSARSRPASCPGLERGQARVAMVHVHREQLVLVEGRLGRARRRPRASRRRCSRTCQLDHRPPGGGVPDWPLRSAISKSRHAVAFGAMTPRPVITTRRRHRGTPIPESSPEQTTVPSSRRISTSAAQLLAPEELHLRPVVVTRSPGFTDAAELDVRVGEDGEELLHLLLRAPSSMRRGRCRRPRPPPGPSSRPG